MVVRQTLRVADIEIHEATAKVILPQSFLDNILREYAQKDLPYPITFAVASEGRQTHVGVREFSAEEGQIILPGVVLDNLATKVGSALSVSLVELQKGESVKLRPLAAGYSLSEDWKTALEGAFRSTYTTLTKGDVIRLANGIKFLVDELRPDEAVCIVDTDLEVDLEPLSEEQAIETVRSNAARETTEMSKTIQRGVSVETSVDLQTRFSIDDWDRTLSLHIRLETDNPDVLLLVGTNAQPPTLDYHIWDCLNSRNSKTIDIEPSNIALAGAGSLVLVVSSESAASYRLHWSQGTDVAQPQESVVGTDEIRCENCLAIVPKRSLVLHERHCSRNNRRCAQPGCDFIFKKGPATNHWHCTECLEPGEGRLELHMARLHTTHICACKAKFPNISSLAYHRTSSCPLREVICQFCHLRVPQGDPSTLSYNDISQNYTAHESVCGSRTTTCESCARPVKLKDLTMHMRLHDSQRLTHSMPRICSNQNCTRPKTNLPAGVNVESYSMHSMGLCKECFGPLYTSQSDPDGSKLQGRVKRRYLNQLMTGCRKPWCRNIYCATATGASSANYSDALLRIEQNINMTTESPRQWFCIDEATQRKHTLAETLECEGEYAIQWCCRALEASGGDLSRARSWLEREAIKKHEEASLA